MQYAWEGTMTKNNLVAIDTPTTTRKPRNKKRTDEQRFLSNVGKADANGCSLWQGSVAQNGYGVISIKGVNQYTHRVAWQLAHNALIPAGLYCLHSTVCTSRLCCNPKHLRLGDAKANALDRIVCGRSGKGESKPHPKFTSAEKETIARLHLAGVSNYVIAATLKRSAPGIAYQIAKNKAELATKLHTKAAGITAAVTELSKAITDIYGKPEKKAA